MTNVRPRRAKNRFAIIYLKRLGDRIRSGRARRGMARRTLARDSGISERFLAELENGSGNPSVLVLRQLADALSLPLVELVGDTDPRTVDYTLIVQTLDRLTSDELIEVRRTLAQRFGRRAGDKEGYISLIGLRGAGKTTLGGRLAEHMGVPFIQLDREVERQCGATIGEILALYGQGGYLRHERQSLESTISQHGRAIIEIGGGLATDPAALDLLLETTRTVWVRALPSEHMQRVLEQGDLRPMAQNAEAMDDLQTILTAREPFYQKASVHLDTSGKTVTQSFRELLKLLDV